ncbi:REP element-mobilizing transposase RayT [Flavobacterium cutihirudinis]|uniref:REP element-mobilizing transposase RayT n=1 Tax=Flavobacterium cutihirudinis TaxID=1265740 RepID=A0A3D9FVR7_9FLAO|nr:transposase [Flavobacterium cutihirudinis]RED24859.1 REP element-mobilizing transposase RayT [Flavobacterium cutihirudinis]
MKLEVLKKDYYYHIYNRGINGTNIFENDANKLYFLKQLAKYLENKISIFGYCLMNNHFHLVIRLNTEEKEVTQAFSNLFNSYAKAFNKQTNRTGSLFEKHFKRINLKDENYLRRLIVYVHLNPRHHFDIDFTDFKFSSYQAFLSNRETKVERAEVLTLFGDLENFIFCHNQKNEFLNETYTFE